jgi:hypothetical protein
MATTLLAWIYCTAICFVVGLCSLRGLRRLFKSADGAPPPFALLCLLGFSVVATLLGWLSLGLRLGGGVSLGLLLATAALCGWAWPAIRSDLQARAKTLTRGELILFAAGASVVLWYSTLVPDWFDSGGYHVQAIRWAHEHRVTPGLGNLLGHLALSSHWFLACAVFDRPLPEGPSLHALNGLVLCWLLSYCLPGLLGLFRGEGKASHGTRVLLLLAVFARYLTHCSSPVTELPATVFLVLLFAERMDDLEGKAVSDPALLTMLALFLPTIKLSTVGALFLLPFLLKDLSPTGWKRSACGMLVLGAAVGLPWMLRNVVLSGYPFYPSVHLDLFDVDWKIPRADVEAMERYVRGWARLHEPTTDATLAMSFAEWVPRWYGALAIYGKVVVGCFAILPLGAILAALWKPSRVRELCRQHRQELLLWGCAYAGAVYWFLMSPDTRFGFPYLLILCLLLARALLSRVTLSVPRMAVGAGVLVFLGLAVLSAVREPRERGTWLLAAPYPPVEMREVPLRRGHAFVPESGSALWDAPVPSTSRLEKDLEWRGERIDQGFRRSGRLP